MIDAASAWPKLASRLMRVALLRSDTTYARLAELLTNDGEEETERSVESRIFRGKVRFSFFLHSLHVMGADLPLLWRLAFASSGSAWDEKATAVFAAELSQQQRVTSTELARRLQVFDADLTESELTRQISDGRFSLVLFMQCMAAIGSSSLERYIDLTDLDKALLRGASAVS